jgi:hypothetical protein
MDEAPKSYRERQKEARAAARAEKAACDSSLMSKRAGTWRGLTAPRLLMDHTLQLCAKLALQPFHYDAKSGHQIATTKRRYPGSTSLLSTNVVHARLRSRFPGDFRQENTKLPRKFPGK